MSSLITMLLPLALMAILFYFLIIRPRATVMLTLLSIAVCIGVVLLLFAGLFFLTRLF